ncbi:uncharacterized protein LOC103572001 [Microplitis demolitor]|uniref:uncharacterized protein LOC103572001 n=1 Tax=Microplitis demolitor TaxID=69319 RepID=UPI00235B5F7F|nr:uncharacterized protein LOC103572001 [Microplitis demolitor]
MRLICSKSRVAPVKLLTLPRLELCASLLLARLYRTVKPAILKEINESYLWSDSTIVLHWINTPAYRLKTFVSNRVAEIQEVAASCYWRHVSSQDNPADLISRGLLPSEFMASSIWFEGPSWLLQKSSLWPNEELNSIDIPELKPIIPKIACMKIELKEYNLIERYSSFSKLQKVIAYIRRFIHNAKSTNQRKFGPLSADELLQSHDLIIQMRGEQLPATSKLIPLNPILDDCGILRVGGRIARASIASDQLHPILLPSQHHITKIIIRAEHIRFKHAGIQSTLYSVRQVLAYERPEHREERNSQMCALLSG